MRNNLETLSDESLAKLRLSDLKPLTGIMEYGQRNFYSSCKEDVEFNKGLLAGYNTFVLLAPMLGTFIYAVFSNKI